MRIAFCLLLLLPAANFCAAAPDFDAQVAPLLAAHCLDCHSGGEPKGELDLSNLASAMRGGESGAAILGGDLEKSSLWQRVAADEMPPKKPLKEKDKKILREWIESGAKWGTDPIDPYRVTSSKKAGYDWWALQPVAKPTAPAKNEIDRQIAAKLSTHSLQPSPRADRRTMIRRLSFDLTGLPPTREEVQKFVDDASPDAYAKLVDRLLDSPHYGERWARHWLDIAHFGESDGFEYDRMRPNAWPYRDWVINTLNADMPYDEFARLQIAGDVLRPDDPEAITASGFLVHGAFDGLMPAGDAMRQIMRQDELEDVVGLVGQTYLGLTVHCARCHDHKFDPVRTEDYYRLASSLAGVRRGERTVPPKVIPKELTDRLTKAQAKFKQLEDVAHERIRASSNAPTVEVPQALARWEFTGDAKEGKPLEGAKLSEGQLRLDGKKTHFIAPLPKDLREKTLEAWVKLDSIDQRGGGVMSIQTPDGSTFDAIVFAERDPGQWLAGSSFFQRTSSFAGEVETSAKEFVQIAIVYAADGMITAYRNGQPYGKAYKSTGPIAFKAAESQVVFGMRHAPVGGNKMLAGRIERAALYDRALSAEEVANSAAAAGNIVTSSQIVAALKDEERVAHTKLAAEIKQLDEQLTRLKTVKVYTLTPREPDAVTHVLIRGNPGQLGSVVAPGGLSGLKLASFDFGLAPNAPEGERRRKLAEWIAKSENPLFARTIVNRVWHYHFGRGLIETPSDLGFNGGTPSHPEVLDYLASELVANRWSLKHLHRLIVNSATYQQASLPRAEAMKVDAGNRLLWRYSPRRLDAESVRDAVLVITGELNAKRGGPSFHDFRPYDNHNSQYYEPIDPVGAEFNRRSIYRMWARGGKSPLLDTLDCPDPSTSTPQRGSTTTPLQALALLNNSFMLRMSDAMAARVKREAGDDAAKQIAMALELAYTRPASETELKLGTSFVSKNGLPAFCRVLLNTNGFLYVD